MANLIDKDFFIYPIALDTSDTDVTVPYLNGMITAIENELLPLVTYDENEADQLADIKNMIGYFTFAEYCKEQLKLNTSTGTVNLQTDGSIKLDNLSFAYARYNDAINIFNTYVTDSANAFDVTDYRNIYGI